MREKKIKVLIVDDSPVARELLAYIVESDPLLRVIGFGENGEKAIEFLKQEIPDVIIMDIVMPKMDGFEATRRIMKTHPVPIVIVSGVFNRDDVEKSFQAMNAGALAILEKPRGIGDPYYQNHVHDIIQAIKTVAEVKLVTRKKADVFYELQGKPKTLPAASKFPLHVLSPNTRIDMIGIGASLGGPQALEQIISGLSKDFSIPILIVQHISPGFSQGLVDWISKGTSLKVKLAEHKEIAMPGSIYFAPDHFHMEISSGNVISLIDGPPEGGVKPAISRLFRSMASVCGPYGLGLILTGMGRDGAEELLLMREKGAVTAAQDEESSIMYGMPREAIQIGAAQLIFSLDQIAPFLNLLSQSGSKAAG